MDKNLQNLLRMDKEERRRARNPFARRSRPYKIRVRPEFTKEELVSFLRENDIKTRYALEKIRRDIDPAPYDYKLVFGNWSNVRLEVWNDLSELDKDIKNDPDYQLRVILQWGLYTAEKYREARRRMPDVVPSFRKILTHWGQFSKAVDSALRLTLKGELDSVFRLCNKLGRVPNMTDFNNHKISLEDVLGIFGSFKALKEYLTYYVGSKERKK